MRFTMLPLLLTATLLPAQGSAKAKPGLQASGHQDHPQGGAYD